MAMEKLTWFKFSPVDWAMGKIQRLPETTQARFIRLCCLYWNKEGQLSYDDAEIEIDMEHLDPLIAKKIIRLEESSIKISFLDEQLENVGDIRGKRKKAAEKRWNGSMQTDANEMQVYANASKNNANALQDSTGAMQTDAEKRREEKRREENIINNTGFAKNCLSETQWCETICMQQKIDPENLEQAITDFENHLIGIAEQKKSLKEFKTHFSNWIPKQDYSKAKLSITGSNQRQPQYRSHD